MPESASSPNVTWPWSSNAAAYNHPDLCRTGKSWSWEANGCDASRLLTSPMAGTLDCSTRSRRPLSYAVTCSPRSETVPHWQSTRSPVLPWQLRTCFVQPASRLDGRDDLLLGRPPAA